MYIIYVIESLLFVFVCSIGYKIHIDLKMDLSTFYGKNKDKYVQCIVREIPAESKYSELWVNYENVQEQIS